MNQRDLTWDFVHVSSLSLHLVVALIQRNNWENRLTFFGPKGVSVPAAVSAFPDELYQLPRNWAERAYPKLMYYNKVDKGGHFAAWEQPKLFSEEVRAGFRSLRSADIAKANVNVAKLVNRSQSRRESFKVELSCLNSGWRVRKLSGNSPVKQKANYQ